MKFRIEFGFGIGEDRNGQQLNFNQVKYGVAAICEQAAKLFGGYTIVDTHGGWINPGGRLVVEAGRTLIVYSDSSLIGSWKLDAMATQIKSELNQAAVAVCETEAIFQVL